ncbi:muscarinic acetylcholine receptor gar-3 [Aplysia californica]|uniref:Muscarinic acetylcholine receptor gar-3 n=1 Tax=Aplysia californica TaxID=6500 RepID=A0ABM0K360_APLCA|nr:muscarinic acetylcholine receptor gar-3 [Aplysia californica]
MTLETTTNGLLGNNTPNNVTDAERIAYLAQLQAQTTRTMIPAMVFLICFSVVGIVGNTLVLIVYSQKFKRTSTRIFIMAIAGFDLVTNVTAIPGEIYDMFHIWDFSYASICRARFYFTSVTTVSAAILLLAVSVVRYRKVCRPFGKQVSMKQAKIICVCIAIFSVVVSIPYAIINGTQTRPTPRPDIVGHECTTDDSFVDTMWPVVNTGFFLLIFLSSCIPLVVLYCLVGAQAWRHSKVYGVTTSPNAHAKVTSGSNSQSSSSGPDTKSTDESTSSGAGGRAKKESVEMNSLDSADGGNNARKEALNTSEGDSAFNSLGGENDAGENSGLGKPGEWKLLENNAERLNDSGSTDLSVSQQTESKQVSAPTGKKISFQHKSSQEGCISNSNSLSTEHDKGSRNVGVGETKKGDNSLNKDDSTGKKSKLSVRSTRTSVIKILSSIRKKKSSTSTLGPAQRRGIGRTTTMLIIISAVYIIGFLPHLIVMFFKFTSPEKFAAMDSVGLTFYNLFLRLYFLNSAANPVIYSLCDVNFRTQCVQVFKFKFKCRRT